MEVLLSEASLEYIEIAIAFGAQTERRGLAWAGEGSAWRRDLTGRSRLIRWNSAPRPTPVCF